MSIFNSQNDVRNSGNPNAVALDHVNSAGTTALRELVSNTIVSGTPDVQRITRYHLYWKFYDGEHWMTNDESFLSMNYVGAFINKVNSFLLGKKGFSFTVENNNDDEVTAEVEKAAEAFINKIWRDNKKILKQYEIFQMGSVCGDAWVLLQYMSDPVFKNSKQKMFITVLDSRHCFPEFSNGDLSNVSAFTIRQPLPKNDKGYAVRVTRYTNDTWDMWYQKETGISATVTKYEPLVGQENSYGFIPIVHLKNRPNSKDYYGKSDMADTMKINKIYNEQGQGILETLDYYRNPTTIVTGGTIKSISTGMGKVWSGLPAEANVFNLAKGDDVNASMTFHSVLKTAMHELSDVPENALGKLQAISNTSATALQVTYQPLIQQADYKGVCYNEGFILMHKMMFKMARVHVKLGTVEPLLEKLDNLMGGSDDLFEDNYSVIPAYTYGLPQDIMSELQEAQLWLMLGLNSKHNIMNEMGLKNVPQILEQITEEKLTDADTQGQVNIKSGVVEDPASAGGAEQQKPM